MPTLHETIVRPVITEKTSEAYQTRGEYTFEVASDASKGQIRQAVERLFAVKVRAVWTSNVRGKAKRVGKSVGTRPNWKKAIVTLKEGTIEIFEG
jgi:large subunit ribosomal protein L23